MRSIKASIGCSAIILFLLAAPVLAGQPYVSHEIGRAARSDGLDPLVAAQEFWTDERLRSAIPMKVRLGPGRKPVLNPGQGNNPPGSGPSRPGLVENDYETEWTNCPASPYTQWYEDNTLTYPNRTIGKLYVSFGERENYVCSAAMVGRNILLTAGQCIHWENRWVEEVMFIPGYHLGQEPYGRWRGRYFITFTGWAQNRNLGLDVGFVLLYQNNNQSLGDIVGYMGVAYNGDPSQVVWNQYAYPCDDPFSGDRLVAVQSGFGEWDAHPDDLWAMGVGNNMTAGNAGGPWVIWLEGWPYAYGLSSYGYPSCAENDYSPYFGQHVADLYAYAWSKESGNANNEDPPPGDDPYGPPWPEPPDPEGPDGDPEGGP